MQDGTRAATAIETGADDARPAARAAARLAMICLFAGALAVGTDGFMIAGLLPQIAREFGTTTAVAAQLVTVFAVTYALAAPLLASIFARAARRRVLTAALGALAMTNALAAAAPSLAFLFGARIAAALAACLYTPAATVAAAGLASSERRGRALSVIATGLALSIVTGVPLGALVGDRFGWRATFAAVAIAAAITAATLRLALPRPDPDSPVATIRDRITAVRTPGVFRVLATTLLGVLAGYLGYTYAAPISHAAGAHGTGSLAVILACFGAGAVAGSVLSGAAADRYRQSLVLRAGLIVQAIALAALAAMDAAGARFGLAPVAIAYTLLGMGSFNYGAPQQRRLIGLAPGSATTVVSLNSSAIYAGIGLSGAIGGLTLQAGPAANGLTGAAIAITTALIAGQRQRGAHLLRMPVASRTRTHGRHNNAQPARPPATTSRPASHNSCGPAPCQL